MKTNSIVSLIFFMTTSISCAFAGEITFADIEVNRIEYQKKPKIIQQYIPALGALDKILTLGPYAIAFSDSKTETLAQLRLAIYNGTQWLPAQGLGFNQFTPYNLEQTLLAISQTTTGVNIWTRGEEQQGQVILKRFDGQEWETIPVPAEYSSLIADKKLVAASAGDKLFLFTIKLTQDEDELNSIVLLHTVYDAKHKKWHELQTDSLESSYEFLNMGYVSVYYKATKHQQSHLYIIYNVFRQDSKLYTITENNQLQAITPTNGLSEDYLQIADNHLLVRTKDGDYYITPVDGPINWKPIAHSPTPANYNTTPTSYAQTVCTVNHDDVKKISCFDTRAAEAAWVSPEEAIGPVHFAVPTGTGIIYGQLGLYDYRYCDSEYTKKRFVLCQGTTEHVYYYNNKTKLSNEIELPKPSKVSNPVFSRPVILLPNKLMLCAGEDIDITRQVWQPTLYIVDFGKKNQRWTKVNNPAITKTVCRFNQPNSLKLTDHIQLDTKINQPIWTYKPGIGAKQQTRTEGMTWDKALERLKRGEFKR